MIRLQKAQEPAVLTSNAETWKQEYLGAIAAGKKRSEIPARYRHATVKSAIAVEAFGKCIYCESKISHALFGDIEHIVPVSIDPSLVVDWTNLGYVCQLCNNHKRDYWDVNLPIINPFGEDPKDHLRFYGPWVTHKAASDRGQITVRVLGLNRTYLLERRKERLDRLTPLVDQVFSMPEGPAKAAMMKFLMEEASASAEYAATVSSYLEHQLVDVPVADETTAIRELDGSVQAPLQRSAESAPGPEISANTSNTDAE
ncbi:HNH endonuclease [Dactylosporangium sp. NPDC006015]|uniref:HNH endonuclease n=1 Tax=Dactylosporangium sp. NPDC006015 TaxID=3154576 RepID=UPI0033A87B66